MLICPCCEKEFTPNKSKAYLHKKTPAYPIGCSNLCTRTITRALQSELLLPNKYDADQRLYPNYIVYLRYRQKQSGIMLLVLQHKQTKQKIFVSEARYNMQVFLGIPLPPKTRILFKDGNKMNTEVSNLSLDKVP